MAKIESYQQATQPLSFSDMLIGTDVLGPIPNATKNFSLTELYNLFATIPNVGNLQDTLNVGNSATQDIFLSGIITCNSITPTFIEDYTLTTGIAGQFLQSSALGIIWATPSVPNLQSVLNSGNTATQNILLTGNISLTKVIPLQIQDSTSSTGSVGQSLFVSVGGLLWANPATVTSIATSGLISGGPITTTGTISTSMTTNRLVGRGTSGTGVMEEIILGTNLSLTGTTLNATSGGVTSVTGTFPVSSSGGATPAISMLQSSSITDGYLSSIDWTTFNNKGSGTVTGVSGTLPISSSGGATPTISITQSSASTNGYLSSTDWTTFNSKQTAITLTTLGTSGASTLIGATLNIPQYTDTYVGTVTSVALTVPSAFSVTGSPITSSGTLAITGAGLASQYIDGTGALQAFPSVGSGTVTSVATAGLISGGAITTTGTITTLMATNRLVGRGTALSGVMEEIILGTNLSLTGTTLNATNSGGTVTSVAALTLGTTGTNLSSTVANGTTTPVITLNVPDSSALNRGALTAADWTTFNNKGSGTVTSVSALTLGTTGTDLSSTIATGTTTPVITLNVPTASALNRGALSSTDWTTFNNKGTGTVTSVAATVPAFLSVSGSPITTSGTLAVTLSGTALPVLNGGTGVTTSTGSGNNVLSTSPTLVTPILGSASATALTFSSTAVSGSTINKLTTTQRQALTPVIGDVVYDTTIGTTCTYNGTFWDYTKEYYVTANVTTTAITASTITGLTTFTLEANSTYNINGQFLIAGGGAGGVKFGNTVPSGAASYISYAGIGTSLTVYQQVASSIGALTAVGINRAGTSSYLTFSGLITTAATSGAVSMQFASGAAAQISTVYGLFSSGFQSKITLTKIA